MKKSIFAAYAVVMIVIMAMFISCENSTFLGVDEIKTKPTPEPGDKVTKYENMEYVAKFDTVVNQLFTVEQKVSVDKVTYQDGSEVSRKHFTEDINLNVKFDAMPTQVYVPEKNMLSEVTLASATSEVEASTETSKADGFTVTETTKNYTFKFDQNENVTASSLWQALSTADILFAYARVKNVSYDTFEAKLNEQKSNADSTVYDVNLFFNVEIKCDKNSAIDKVYAVRVPFLRIYKNGEVPDIVVTKIENEAYEAQFDIKVKELYTVRQENSADLVTYKNGKEIERENWVRDINLEALFNVNDVAYVDKEEDLATVTLMGSSFDGDVVGKQEDGKFTTTSRSLNYNFRFNEGETVKSATAYEALTYEEKAFEHSTIENVSYKQYEANQNMEKSNADSTVYDVTLYFDVKVKRENPAAPETRAQEQVDTYTVAVPFYRVLKHEQKDELIGKRYQDVARRILNATTEELSWTEVQIWSLSGEKFVSMEGKLYRHWTSPSLQWVFTDNNLYATNSNGKKIIREAKSTDNAWSYTTRYEQYSSTATNGVNSFDNVYLFDYQSAVYTDPDGYYTLNFEFADWNVVEAGSTVSTVSSEVEKEGIVYNVWDYLNTVSTVYSIEGDHYDGTDKAETKIAIEKPVEDIIDGNILSMGVSAVPSDDVANVNTAMKAFCIVYEKNGVKGAASIVVDMGVVVPSKENYANAYHVSGDFNAEYNSAYFTTSTNKGSYQVNKWAPAIAKDESSRIAYYSGSRLVRNVKTTTLSMWHWRDGNNSTVIDGYNFNVTDNGVLTIRYNGKIVARFK